MKILTFLISICCVLSALVSLPAHAAFSSIAFYYGANPPSNELKAFDLAVVDPDQGLDPTGYRSRHSEAVAYVSIGEIDPRRAYSSKVPRGWLIGTNSTWSTSIVDQTNPEWQKFFLNEVIEPLWQKGYRGFFLDTLDSYRLAVPAEAWQQQAESLALTIKSVKRLHPEAKIILNRGFELLGLVSESITAVAAESLFQQWDQKTGKYGPVPEESRSYLLKELKSVTAKGIPAVVIDYVAPGDRPLARQTARRIAELGFIPWVADGHLESLGIGAVEVMPRRILGFYDGSEAADPVFTLLHRMATMPLNYLGYTVEFHDVRKPLPTHILAGRYAGIVVWTNSYLSGIPLKLNQWILRRIREGLHVVFLDNFGFPATGENLRPFGLAVERNARTISTNRISKKDQDIGFEIAPSPRMDVFLPVRIDKGKVLLQVQNEDDQLSDAVAITEWGGYALYPYALDQLPDDQTRWVINPFTFFKNALRLPDIPLPDTTSENGRRLLMVHVDGDGFVERARFDESKFAGEVALEEIFTRYRIPTTVSVIEGEISSAGINAKNTERLESTARRIFALPWIEIASHSFSHPFKWSAIGKNADRGGYHLDIPGYTFDLEREIKGSVEYANRLAPAGKQVRLFLWTGDCLPGANALSMVTELGIGNMNGGETTMTESDKTVSRVSPLGIQRDGYFQVFAPNQNENVYTNLWTGPFYGFERIIETFRLTDRPRRLKPLNIYFHFYSASRKASLGALHKVFGWALDQPTFPTHASAYLKRVTDYNSTVVAKSGDGWLIRNGGMVRQLRIPASLGYPDLIRSSNIVGFSKAGDNDSTYIHLGPDGEARLSLTGAPPSIPFVYESNASVSRWEHKGDEVQMEFQGTVPLSISVGGAAGYAVISTTTLKEMASTTPGVRLLVSPQVRDTLVFRKIQ